MKQLKIRTKLTIDKYSITGVMRFMEIQRRKEEIKSQQFNRKIGATGG
jgi:hypothetical protein